MSPSDVEYGFARTSTIATSSSFSFLITKFAIVGPWTSSLGTFRKNVGPPSFFVVSVGRVADGDTITRFAGPAMSAVEITPWLVDGPIIPRTFRSETNCCATVRDLAGSSCVSPWRIVIRVLNCLLKREIANCDQLSCSLPRKPASPVSGPEKPRRTFEHAAGLAAVARPFAYAPATSASMAATAAASAIAPVLRLIKSPPPCVFPAY